MSDLTFDVDCNPLDAGGWPIVTGAKVRVNSRDNGPGNVRTVPFLAEVVSIQWDEEGENAVLILKDNHGGRRYADAKQVTVRQWQSVK